MCVFLSFTATGQIVSNQDFSSGTAACQGLNSSVRCLQKFGKAPSFPSAVTSTIWGGANSADIAEYSYNYSPDNTANIDSVSSTSTGDTQSIIIEGLDINYNFVSQAVTLTGQTRAALTTPLVRAFRVQNMGITDFAGFIYIYVNTALSGGRPIDTTQIRVVVDSSDNQTLMAMWTVPAGKTLSLKSFHFSIDAGNKASNYVVRLRVRNFGGVFRTQWEGAISDVGSSFLPYYYSLPLQIAEKSDIEMTAKATAAGVTGAAVTGSFEGEINDN
jgi:hypothetical protein